VLVKPDLPAATTTAEMHITEKYVLSDPTELAIEPKLTSGTNEPPEVFQRPTAGEVVWMDFRFSINLLFSGG
jgi:hypothetical protein